MKKEICILFSMLLVIGIIVFAFPEKESKGVIISNTESVSNNLSSSIAMMYESDFGSGVYVVSDDTSWPSEGYIFNETLSKCENGSKLTYNSETKKIILQTNISDKCYVYFDKSSGGTSPVSTDTNFDYVAKLYTSQGENGLYYHDSTLANGAEDGSYRYAGENPNNYVCFGSNDATCPENNLYRIVGIFNGQIKLIKNTSIGNNYWSGASDKNSNNWINSTLNTGVLNGTYLEGLGDWANYVSNHNWKVGGLSSYQVPAKTIYGEENKDNGTTHEAKIGLMYVSDYGYGAAVEKWQTNINAYDANNWLYSGANEWTIASQLNTTSSVFYITSEGNISNGEVNTISIGVRPTFYLNSSIKITNGAGTTANPYRLSV